MTDYMNSGSQESTSVQRAWETLVTFMKEDGWYPQPMEEGSILRSQFVGRNGEFSCFAQLRPDLEQFIFYVVMPQRAPEATRIAVAEFITRANYGMRVGNFELDFDDGEVRYKNSIDFEGAELTPALIRNVMYPSVQTMDRYQPGLMRVIYGGAKPAEAVAEIEEA